MKSSAKGESPLQKLVQLCENTLPTKVQPKLRPGAEAPKIAEVLEIKDVVVINEVTPEPSQSAITVNNFVLNFNLDMDSEAMKKMSQESVKLAKGLAAGAAMAMIGTAAYFLQEAPKKVRNVKIPLLPRVKVPKAM